MRRSLSASTIALPTAVRPPRPRLRPDGDDVAPSVESVRCMSVTRSRSPSGTRRTSAGESKAFAALDGEMDRQIAATCS